MAQTQFMPILFKVLFGFVALNMVINFTLLLMKNQRIYRLLSLFWPAVLVTFILQSMTQGDPRFIALAYSSTLVPMTIFAMIGLEVIGKKLPWKPLLVIYGLSFPLSHLLFEAGLPFDYYAMPFAAATAAPLLFTGYSILIQNRRKSTRLQMLLGVILFSMAIHCINFALFRMEENTQLWGWLISYALYDTLAILLPSIALEDAKMKENEKLQELVDEKTVKLRRSLKDNEGLLKVLMHDIANPLMVIKFYGEKILGESTKDLRVEKINKSAHTIEEIIQQVKNRYMVQKGHQSLTLAPVSLDECFQEVSFIYAHSLEKKKIDLKFSNYTSRKTKVLADKASLTHSVLSNLISNALKFSRPGSEVEIIARETGNSVTLEVKDAGPGIPKEVIDQLLLEETVLSTDGTEGEAGQGFGLSIARSFVHSYGGEIEFESMLIPQHKLKEGSNIRISLDRA
jgi:signal transduction histidine kinase